ncbi:MAG: hypothetical protein PHP73_00990 [Candidatus Omnitrophica bacterium]|nr:hypothetical protein [Candidatus Omnitrophota bacterium]
MKSFRTKVGPFAERPYYKLSDIENICNDELRKVDLLPSEPSPIRIERFIEKRFRIFPSYEDLPEGVLGCIKFGTKGVEEIKISKFLSEDGDKVSERRINTTLAHEAGHGLLHAHLFVLGLPSQSLFENEVVNTPTILCREGAVTGIGGKSNYDGRWWEFQANRAMGALLLPRFLVQKSTETFLVSRGAMGIKTIEAKNRESVIKTLVDAFDVNPAVARIRIDEMYFRDNKNQLTF